MFTLFFWLLLIALTFYCGWLHRRLKTLEQKAGVPTPVFAGVEERRVQQLIQDALRQFAREKL